LLLDSFASNLVNLFRLQLPWSLRSAQSETLRTQLFKIPARFAKTARCIRIHLASGWPLEDLFQAASLCNSS
jgi:Transposase DDE domain group 1